MKRFFIFATLLLVACENREEPVHFAIAAAPNYSFSADPNLDSFAITGNISWQATLTNGGEWCSITPTSAHGDGTVEISVAANTDYLQERTAAIVVKAGAFSKEITITQAAPPCLDFDPGAIATAGQTVTVGGTPAVISSTRAATGGDGQISYQWYKNGYEIWGATEAYYTPSPYDANTAGAITYTRRAADNTCNNTLMPSTGSWVLTVTCPSFSSGAIATTGQTICSGSLVTIIPNSASAYSGSGNITYQWRQNGTAISNANAAVYNPSVYSIIIGAHTFTRWVKDGVCATDWTQSAGQWLLTVNSTPSITLISGNASQTKLREESITTIKYTTTNATNAYLSGGALPAGVTGSWSANTYTISGTISSSAAVQTYNYTVATTNSNGCANTATSGAITVNANIAATTPPGAYSTNTWVFGSQTWSDRIVADPSNCTQTDNLSTSDNSSTEYKIYEGRYYYLWTCAYNNRESFCPAPWRLPSLSDFDMLVSNTDRSALISAWGYGGYATGSSINYESSGAYYWSSTEYSSNSSYYLYYYSGNLGANNFTSKYYGFLVRCVK
jgi:hypothetical protein